MLTDHLGRVVDRVHDAALHLPPCQLGGGPCVASELIVHLEGVGIGPTLPSRSLVVTDPHGTVPINDLVDLEAVLLTVGQFKLARLLDGEDPDLSVPLLLRPLIQPDLTVLFQTNLCQVRLVVIGRRVLRIPRERSVERSQMPRLDLIRIRHPQTLGEVGEVRFLQNLTVSVIGRPELHRIVHRQGGTAMPVPEQCLPRATLVRTQNRVVQCATVEGWQLDGRLHSSSLSSPLEGTAISAVSNAPSSKDGVTSITR